MKNKALKRLIFGLVALPVCFSLFSFTLLPTTKIDTVVNSGFKLKTIIVDAGHGGAPTGTGHFSHGASGSFSTERGVTLAVALKLQKAIEKNVDGVHAVLTRKTEDDVSFEKRAEIANENKGDLFISLHCNALPDRVIRERVGTKRGKGVYKTARVADKSGKGVLMLVYALKRTKEQQNEIKSNTLEEDIDDGSAVDPNDPITVILTNEYNRRFRLRSIKFANILASEFVDEDERKLEGVREQSLYVLCHSAMPSVLIEIGYITNPEEEQYLNSEEGQDAIVKTIVQAIKIYKDDVEQVAK
ncbi:N-acetylmuramoyl-L-alanine amidase [Mucilaginibacter corticis]|uniref:N-acetylmuramoyl-L-alanine amidase n=1 Tax=Mucilaginibacter corticis TaxID=2597670 RepID=A0A556MHS4_9SPHI|nr:N-acetylmuramoyl-L-alanine amidase [Mucilaginibacter corticis]TSJ39461.1 N-acetylmuramoyl-L-alanine amidase [Mucilaginibacter corticis]